MSAKRKRNNSITALHDINRVRDLCSFYDSRLQRWFRTFDILFIPNTRLFGNKCITESIFTGVLHSIRVFIITLREN